MTMPRAEGACCPWQISRPLRSRGVDAPRVRPNAAPALSLDQGLVQEGDELEQEDRQVAEAGQH